MFIRLMLYRRFSRRGKPLANRHRCHQTTRRAVFRYLLFILKMDPAIITAFAALVLIELLKNKRERSVWFQPVLSNRLTTGIFLLMFSVHRDNPYKFFRMTQSRGKRCRVV